MTTSITDPLYSSFLTAFNSAYTGFDTAVRDEMWNFFLNHFGYVSNGQVVQPPDFATFQSFLLNRTLSAAPSFYSTALMSLWSQPSPTLTTLQKEELWQEFLDSQNLSVDPPASDIATQGVFQSYIADNKFSDLPAAFTTIFTTAFGSSLQPSSKQAYWVQFLAANNLPANPPEDPQFLTLFQNYIATGPKLLSNAPAEYTTIMSQKFGNALTDIPGSTSANIQQTEESLWASFLSTQGYSSNPPDDPAIEAAFTTYLTTNTAFPQPPSQYGILFQNVFGTTLSASVEQKIWDDFLLFNHLPSNPPESSWIINSIYVPFINSRSIASSINQPFLQAITTLFGLNSLTFIQQEELWQAYLLANNFTTPEDTQPTSANVSNFQQFINTTSITAPQAAGFLAALNATITLSSPEQKEIWDTFLASQGYVADPPTDSQSISTFTTALISLAPSQAYQTYIQSLYPDQQLTNDELVDLWLGFLSSAGYGVNNPPPQPPTVGIKNLISTYITNIQQIPAPFIACLTTTFGPSLSLSPVSVQIYWTKFLTKESLASNPPANSDFLARFRNYINTTSNQISAASGYNTTLSQTWDSTLIAISEGNQTEIDEAKQALWAHFLAQQGYPSNPPDDQLIEGNFINFLTNSTLPPVPNQYRAALQNIFSNTGTEQQLQQLWTSFLQAYSLPGNPPESSWIISSLFIPFINVPYVHSITSTINALYLQKIVNLWSTTLTPAQQEELWLSYLQTNTLTTPEQTDPTTANLALFDAFIRIGNISAAPSYLSIFSTLSPQITSLSLQQDIWQRFLTVNNYPDNPPADSLIITAFTTYLTHVLTISDPINAPFLQAFQTTWGSIFTFTPADRQAVWVNYLNYLQTTTPPQKIDPTDTSVFQGFITSQNIVDAPNFLAVLTSAQPPVTSPQLQEELWQRFLADRGYPGNPPTSAATPSIIADFTSYIAIDSITNPDAAAFKNLFNTNGILHITSPVLQQNIWKRFLTADNYPGNPPADPPILTAFTNYLNSVLTISDPINALYLQRFTTIWGTTFTSSQQQAVWLNYLQTTNTTPPQSTEPTSANLTAFQAFITINSIAAPSAAAFLAVYQTANNINLFGDPQLQQIVWQHFLTLHGYPGNPPETSSIISSFSSYVTSLLLPSSYKDSIYLNSQATLPLGNKTSQPMLEAMWIGFLGSSTSNPNEFGHTQLAQFVDYIRFTNPTLYTDLVPSRTNLGTNQTQYINVILNSVWGSTLSHFDQELLWSSYLMSIDRTLGVNWTVALDPPAASPAGFQTFLQTTSLTSPLAAQFLALLDPATITASTQAAIWQQFLADNHYQADPPPDAGIVAAFQSYVSSIVISQPVITSVTDIGAAAFLSIFNANAGFITSSTLTQSIWQQFLTARGYTTNPPPTSANLADFTGYLNSVLSISDPVNTLYFQKFGAVYGGTPPTAQQEQDFWTRYLQTNPSTINPTSGNLSQFQSFITITSIFDPSTSDFLAVLENLPAPITTPELQSVIWQKFLTAKGFTHNPAATQANITLFQNYLNVNPFPGFSDFQWLIDQPSTFGPLFPSFVPFLIPPAIEGAASTANPTYTADQIQAMWLGFITSTFALNVNSGLVNRFSQYIVDSNPPFTTNGSPAGPYVAVSGSTSTLWSLYLFAIDRSLPTTNFNDINGYFVPPGASIPGFTSFVQSTSISSPQAANFLAAFNDPDNLTTSLATKQLIWQSYLTTNSLTHDPSPTPALVTSFTAFLSNAIVSQSNSDLITQVYGPATTLSVDQIEKIWLGFLAQSTYPTLSMYISSSLYPFSAAMNSAAVSALESASGRTSISQAQQNGLQAAWSTFLSVQNLASTVDYSIQNPGLFTPTFTAAWENYITNAYQMNLTSVEPGYTDTVSQLWGATLAALPGSTALSIALAEQQLWGSYVTSKNQTSIGPGHESDFASYLTVNTLSTALSSYITPFQTAYGSGLSATQEQEIWTDFLTANGIPGNPTSSVWLVNLLTRYLSARSITNSANQLYSNALTAAWGATLTSNEKETLWQTYLLTRSFANPPDPTVAQNITDFTTFLTSHSITDPAAITFKGLFATNNTLQITSTTLQQDIWTRFLLSKGYPGTPPASTDKLTKFTTYLANSLDIQSSMNAPFAQQITDAWGSSTFTQAQKQSLWISYLQQIPPPTTIDPTNSTNLASFKTFVTAVSSSILDPTANAFSSLFSTYSLLQNASTTLKQELWQRFLTANHYPGNPPTNPPILNAFVTYLNSTIAILDPINAPFLQQITNTWGSFTFTQSQEQDFWARYLQQNPSPSSLDPTNPTNLTSFKTFVNQALGSITDSSAQPFSAILDANNSLTITSAAIKQSIWSLFLTYQENIQGTPPSNALTTFSTALNTLLPSSAYQTDIENMYSPYLQLPLASDQKNNLETLWLGFLSANNYGITNPVPQPPTPAIESALQTYVGSVDQIPLTFIAPVTAFYTTLCGTAPTDLQPYWTQFLLSQGILVDPTDPQTLTLFESYITNSMSLALAPAIYTTTLVDELWDSTLNSIPGATPADVQQAKESLWASFLAQNGFMNPTDDSLASDFVDFLESGAVPLPPNPYATVFQNASTYQDVALADQWSAFTNTYGFPGNPPTQSPWLVNLFASLLQNRSITNIANKPYLDVITSLWGPSTLTSVEEETLWQNYLVYNGFIVPSIETDPTVQANIDNFRTFINSNSITSPEATPFLEILTVSGPIPISLPIISPVTAPTITQTIWQAFLTSRQYTTNPPADPAIIDDFTNNFLPTIAIPNTYANYIANLYVQPSGFIGLSPTNLEEIWLGTLAANGYTTNPGPSVSDSTIKSALSAFVQGPTGVEGNQFTYAAASYQAIMNSIFGPVGAPGSLLTAADRQNMWAAFLQQPNPNDPNGPQRSSLLWNPPDDSDFRALFTAFLTQNSITSPQVGDFNAKFAQFTDPLNLITPAIKQQIWTNFLLWLSPPFVSLTTGNTVNPPNTPVYQNAFDIFLHRSVTPTTGVYFTSLQNSFTPSVLAALDTQTLSAIWQEFMFPSLYPNALPSVSTAIPPDATTTAAINAIAAAFTSYLTDRLFANSGSGSPSFISIATNFFGNAIQSSPQSATLKEVLWQNFLLNRHEYGAPTNNNINQTAWTTYLNNHLLLTAADSNYQTAITNSFAGMIASTAQKQALWQNFLTTQGYVTDPPYTNTPPSLYIDAFNAFLAQRIFSAADPQFQATVIAALGKAATPSIENIVWQGWLTSHSADFAVNPAYSATINGDLSSYLQGILLTNADSHYRGIVDVQLGNTFTGAEEQVVWLNWLSSQGLSTNPPYVSTVPTTAPTTDPTTLGYVSSLLSYVTAVATQSTYPNTSALNTAATNATVTGGTPPVTYNYGLIIPSNTALTQTIWTAFMKTQDPTAPITQATATAFQAYLQARLPTGFYITTLQTLDKGPTATPKTATDQLADWERFLATQGLTAAPAQSIDAEKQFVTYLQNAFVNAQHLGVFSPLEIQKRQIMFLVFELAQKMLKILEDTVAVQANNLIFLGKWQQQYTTMMTSVPIYTSTPTNVWTPDTTDATKFTLGYNNLSVDDVSQYLASNALPTTVGVTATTFDLTAYTNQTTDANGKLNYDTALFDYIHFNADPVTTTTGSSSINPFVITTSTTYGSITAINPTNFISSTTIPKYVNGLSDTETPATLLTDLQNAQSHYVALTGTSNVKLGVLILNLQTAINTRPSSIPLTLSNVSGAILFGWSGSPPFTTLGTPAQFLGILSTNVNQALQQAVGTGDTVSVGINAGDSAELQQQKWNTAFLTLYNNTSNHPAMTLIKTGGTLPTDNIAAGAVIPWQQGLLNPYASNATVSDQVQANSGASSARAQENAKLQQTVENIRARRDIVGNSMQTMQTNITQTQQALSKQSDLLTSIIQTLQTIASSIAR